MSITMQKYKYQQPWYFGYLPPCACPLNILLVDTIIIQHTSSRAHEKGCGCSRQIFGWIYFIISFSVDLCKQFYFLCLGVGSIRAQNIEADQQIIIFVVLQSSGLQFIIYMLVKKYLDEHQWLKQGLLLLLLLLLITHTSGNFH
eukprot:TRINITY_DN4247_c1_g1_i8.p1 TRINITY_DN4247_c1_g1~~TRINITY_DN4247_c1_g1_i8.p1  ORF type:complete len:144 (-),score=4.62 TRINITY_DN4247_c1_g1_i8:100-531(-)